MPTRANVRLVYASAGTEALKSLRADPLPVWVRFEVFGLKGWIEVEPTDDGAFEMKVSRVDGLSITATPR